MPYDHQTLDKLRQQGQFGEDTPNPIYLTPAAAELIGDHFGMVFLSFRQFKDWDPDLDSKGLHEVGKIPFMGQHILFHIVPVNVQEDLYSVTFMLNSDW